MSDALSLGSCAKGKADVVGKIYTVVVNLRIMLIRHDIKRVGNPVLNWNKMAILIDIHLLPRHPFESQIDRLHCGRFCTELAEIIPVGWDLTTLHKQDSTKIIVKDNVILERDSDSLWFKYKSNAIGMKGRMPKVHTDV